MTLRTIFNVATDAITIENGEVCSANSACGIGSAVKAVAGASNASSCESVRILARLASRAGGLSGGIGY